MILFLKEKKKSKIKAKLNKRKFNAMRTKNKRSQKREKSEAIKLSMILSRYLFYGIKSKIEDGRKQNQQSFVIILHKKAHQMYCRSGWKKREAEASFKFQCEHNWNIFVLIAITFYPIVPYRILFMKGMYVYCPKFVKFESYFGMKINTEVMKDFINLRIHLQWHFECLSSMTRTKHRVL